MRKGDWKLVVKGGVCELYNLADDIHEDNNVAAQYPDKVKELKQVIKEQHTTSSVAQFNNLTLPSFD